MCDEIMVYKVSNFYIQGVDFTKRGENQSDTNLNYGIYLTQKCSFTNFKSIFITISLQVTYNFLIKLFVV